MWPALETLLPSAGLLFLLYLVLRHMMEGDRRERMAQAKWEQEHPVAPITTDGSGTGPIDNAVDSSEVIGNSATGSAKTPHDS